MSSRPATSGQYSPVESDYASEDVEGGTRIQFGRRLFIGVLFGCATFVAAFLGAAAGSGAPSVAVPNRPAAVPSATEAAFKNQPVPQASVAFSPQTDVYSSGSPIFGLGAQPTCAGHHCGGRFEYGRACQCTDECEEFSNCCDDFVAVCKFRPTPPPTPAPAYGDFVCKSDLDFGAVVVPERKGLALDDTTFENCADQIPRLWPNTNQSVSSVRLFKPWGMTQPKYFKGDRNAAWKGLKGFAEASGAKFLVGISLTCTSADDEREWAAGREFIKYVGAKHVMGVAVGNEVDLHVPGRNARCVRKLWNDGGYAKILKQRVAEFDALPGMKGLPVTAVISMFALNGKPFSGHVTTFLRDAWKTYGDRFKLSMNIYPQFSNGLASAGCSGSVDIGTKFGASHPVGFIPNVAQDIKRRLKQIGAGDMKLWIGEHGWATHGSCALCSEACHSPAVQQRYYKNFLKWDLSTSDVPAKCGEPAGECAASILWAKTDGIHSHPDWYGGLGGTSTDREFQIHLAGKETAEGRGGCQFPCDAPGTPTGSASASDVDHVFYFTLRDSFVFGKAETFGILDRCGSNRCKFQK